MSMLTVCVRVCPDHEDWIREHDPRARSDKSPEGFGCSFHHCNGQASRDLFLIRDSLWIAQSAPLTEGELEQRRQHTREVLTRNRPKMLIACPGCGRELCPPTYDIGLPISCRDGCPGNQGSDHAK